MQNNFYTHVGIFGNNLIFRGVENGKRVKRKIPYKPCYFLDSNQETPFKTIKGNQVQKYVSDNIKGWKNDVREYTSYGKSVHGNISPVNQFIAETYKDEISFDPSLIKIYNFDIEVNALKKEDEIEGFPYPDKAELPITAITTYNSITKKYLLLGLEDWNQKDILSSDGKTVFVKSEDIKFHRCKDEETLLEVFLKWWANDPPDIITGWNIQGFDIPYLINRIEKVLGFNESKRLSPWNFIKSREKVDKFGKDIVEYTLEGITTLDYLDLYKQYTYGTPESYKLDAIGEKEIGEKKLSYSQYSSLSELYFNDVDLYFDYNIKDTALVQKIDDKMKLIDIALTVAFYAKINFVDVYSPINTWDSLIYNHLLEKNIVIPPSTNNHKDGAIPGGYVKTPIPGKYRWILSFDLEGLYPAIIRSLNMGIDTYIEQDDVLEALSNETNVNTLLDEKVSTNVLKERGISMTANGQFFDNSYKSFPSELLEILYNKRKAWKKSKLMWERKEQEDNKKYPNEIAKFNNLQLAAKLLMNALYGSMTSVYFRYYKNEIAEGITQTGQLVVKWAANSFNDYLQNLMKDDKDRVIAVDTDSVVGSTLIRVNGKLIKIEDYYKHSDGFLENRGHNNFIKKIYSFDECYSYNTKTELPEYKAIKYVMSHEIEKEMFVVSYDGFEVEMTCDHSMIVKRDNEFYTSVKPDELLKSDSIVIYARGLVDNFKVKSLGIKKIKVYDIEVEDNHNFFANDILVHNSNYLNMEEIVDKFFPNKTKEETVDLLDKIGQEKLFPYITKQYAKLCDTLNTHQQLFVMEREAISDCIHPDSLIGNESISKIFDGIEDTHYYNQDEQIKKYNLDITNRCLVTNENEIDEIEFIIKKRYCGDMYKITQNGKTINVTADHMILIESNDKSIWKKAKDLIEIDIIVELN